MPDNGKRKAAIQALSAAPTVAGLRAAISTWAPRFHDSLNNSLHVGPRPELGMDVGRIPGRGAVAARRGNTYFVGLGTVGNMAQKRFTLAHELAHVLLDGTDREALGLDRATEEDLCELFARRALAPPALVQQHLRRVGMPIDLADIDRFADRFRISLRASLVVLNEVSPRGWPVAFVAASWRTHPRGDEVLGMRIDVSAADNQRFFLPKDCRLATLGYRRLEAWSLKGEVGTESSGRDMRIAIPSWRPRVSKWVGESEWVARRHFAPGSRANADERAVLCRLNVGHLTPRQSRRRHSSVRVRDLAPVDKIPGQLGL